MLGLTIDLRGLEGVARNMALLREDIFQRATASALNKTLDQGRTEMARDISAEFNLPISKVRDRLRIRRAVSRGKVRLEGSLEATGKRSMNIIAFAEKSVTLAEGRRRKKGGTQNQLYVKVKRAGGLKTLPGAFIGNNGRTVFERIGPGRLPIRPVNVIDVPQMFNTKRINAAVVKVMRERFGTIFAREASFFLQKFNRGGR